MSLEALGLSEQESLVYRTLVQTPPPTASTDLALASGLSRGAVERGLSGLVTRGMVRRLPGHRARYAPVEPGTAVGALIRDQEERLASARGQLRELESSYRKSVHRANPAELIEVIEGRKNIMDLYHRLIQSATMEMRYFSRPPYFSNSPSDEAEQAERMADGIVFRVIYDTEALASPDDLAAIRRNVARGERARVTGTLPMEMMIVDDTQALIPLDLGTLESAYLVQSSSLLVALAALFETTWSHSTPAYLATNVSGPRGGETTDRDALLVLLASGLTDKAIRRHLGLSTRTLQRRIQTIYTELGATTRFQAGVAARHRAWIKPEDPHGA